MQEKRENTSTLKKRILEYLEYKSITKTEFSKKIGIDSSNFRGNALSSELKSGYIAKILTVYQDINADWLICGQGLMLKKIEEHGRGLRMSIPSQIKILNKIDKENNIKNFPYEGKDNEISKLTDIKHEILQESKVSYGKIGVPYYDIDITATITESFSDIKEQPDMLIDFKPFNDCTAYLPIYGDSMYPQFASGEIVAVKEIMNHNVILFGEPYLIITNGDADNMRTLKILRKHEDDDKIILKPSNPNFDETIIPKKAILGLYLVKGKITRKQL